MDQPLRFEHKEQIKRQILASNPGLEENDIQVPPDPNFDGVNAFDQTDEQERSQLDRDIALGVSGGGGCAVPTPYTRSALVTSTAGMPDMPRKGLIL